MLTSTHLLKQRRFLPLFATQLLNAFNDNLFKNAMVLFVVYSVYNSEEAEAQFSAIASGLFILPFFVLSALSGQLADMRDKARDHPLGQAGRDRHHAGRRGRAADGLARAADRRRGDPADAAALFAMGVHSTFFGPIKYAILPQHLNKDEVLAGHRAGRGRDLYRDPRRHDPRRLHRRRDGPPLAWFSPPGRLRDQPPGAPRPAATSTARAARLAHLLRAAPIALVAQHRCTSARCSTRSWRSASSGPSARCCSSSSRRWPRTCCIASKEVASLFLVIFSIGVAIGSVAINALLKGDVSARYAPISVLCDGRRSSRCSGSCATNGAPT